MEKYIAQKDLLVHRTNDKNDRDYKKSLEKNE